MILLPLSAIRQMSDEDREKYLNSLSEEQRASVIDRLNSTPAPVTEIDSQAFPEFPTGDLTSGIGDIPAPTPDVDDDGARTPEESKERLLQRLGSLSNIAATMVDVDNMSDPSRTSVGVGAGAGAVKGAVKGAALGPIGMVGGAILGSLFGGAKAGEQREAYEEEQRRKRDEQIYGLRTAPSIREKGGIATGTGEIANDIPLTTERGEIMLLPDGRLVDVMSKKTHKQQSGKEKKEVTDIVPDPTFVFSNSEKRLINLDKIADDIFKHTKGRYSEDGNTPMQIIRVGDILGRKGKKTPAEIVKGFRKKYPIVEKPIEDIEKRTNVENLRQRAEALKLVMQLQEGVYEPFEFDEPEFMEKGGFYKKKKKKRYMQEGGLASDPTLNDLLLMSPEEREQMLLAMPESQRTQVQDRLNYHQKNMGLGELQGGLSSALTSPKYRPPAAQPTPTQPLQQNPAAPAIADRYENNVLDKVDPLITEESQRIDSSFDNQLAELAKLSNRQRLRNIGSLASRLFHTAGQDPTSTPETQSSRFVGRAFPEIQESEIQDQVGRMGKRGNRILAQINESGIRGSSVGSASAPILSSQLEAEGRVRSKALEFNKSQEGRRYDRMNQILNANRAAEASAENATRSARNRISTDLGGIGAEYIDAQGGLENAISTRRSELQAWRDRNKSQLTDKQFNKAILEEEREMRKVWFQENQSYMRDKIDELIQQFNK